MHIGKLLFVVFLLVPLTEIWVLLEVGSVIGALPTVALVVLTAVVGAGLIRAQGLATLARARDTADRGEVPAMELLEGLCLLVAGAFLLTPGFVTDTLGFALLVPALRRGLFVALLERGMLQVATRGGPRGARPGAGAGGGGGGRVIEGEYRREDP